MVKVRALNVLKEKKKLVFIILAEVLHIFKQTVFIIFRYGNFDKLRQNITQNEGGLGKFSFSFTSFGIHFNEDNSICCKEWAPGVHKLYLYGDFSKSITQYYI